MKKAALLILCFFLLPMRLVLAQTSDDSYKQPLEAVLAEAAQRFDLVLDYPEELVKDKWLNYAAWRFRATPEETLTNVLSPFDLVFTKEGENSYRIRPFEYHRRSVEDGRATLAHLASLYHDVASWEERKKALRECIYETLHLFPLPEAPASEPIITGKRKMNGYTIENIAIELLPGLWVNGSLYRPARIKGKIPVVLSPDGHFEQHRFRPDCQYRCATLARMGAMTFSYDLFAWGESLLQFKPEDHRRSLAMTIQALGGIRILDYLLSLDEADTNRVAMTGASGGGSQTMLLTALDDRIKVSAPVVMLSSYFYGGCPCETGLPVHLCAGGTNNPELAAMAAPQPQLIVSDGKDWTDHVPEIGFPYLQKMYGYYGKKDLVQNVHLPDEGHDYGISKRVAVYKFLARYLDLNLDAVTDASGKIDESACTIEKPEALYVFGPHGENLPEHAIRGFGELEQVFKAAVR